MIGDAQAPKTAYFSFQGAVLIGDREAIDNAVDVDDDATMTPAGQLSLIGNVPKLDYSINSDIEEIKDSYTGLRQTDYRQSYADTIEFNLELYDASPLALQIAHRGTYSLITAGSVSDASIIVYQAAQKRYVPVLTLPTPYAENYFVGQRGTDGKWAPLRNLNAATLLVKDSTATPKTLVAGTNYLLSPRTGSIRFIDLTTGGAFAAPLKGNTNFGTVTDLLSNRIAWGAIQPLSHQNITSFQIQDSAGTPAVVDETYYSLDPIYGELTFLASKLAAFEAENYVLPLKAVYNHGLSRNISLLSAPLDTEYWMRFRGKNTANGGRPFVADFYRVQFAPVNGAQLIHERTGKLPLKATALADPTKNASGPLGRVGRFVLL